MADLFIDASALVAILNEEPEALLFLRLIEEACLPVTSPVATFETVLAVMRITGWDAGAAQDFVTELLAMLGIAQEPVTPAIASEAVSAFARFGKGRHPAALNLGDCFAYGAARTLGAALLFTGDDFSRTDIARP
ncbi:type II toxin-antitoxin system VapC family toxin [Xanthobacter tagetidis]|uniref:type II toxin-antitoxin system VapC family toxin n=1 Tax=Xanthobacter tagetidis TaxID=60216 RepID=UPI00179FC629|nr:type II toxin-antitoxin system VapC family toxin [Xanthobacter tagetidis]MBB6306647.1 ribonuclease VapC [Xanthobacter tagetidis]